MKRPPRPQPHNLEQMLDQLQNGAQDRENVSVATMMEAIGARSFSPVLLLAGLIMFSPLSGIPGLPTTAAMMVLLIAAQMLLGRRSFWIPPVIARRSVSRERFVKMLNFSYPVARFIDRFLKPRLTSLTHDAGRFGIAILCVFIALSVPPLELVPFLSSIAGGLLVLLGLALIAHDGLIALVAIVGAVGLYVSGLSFLA